VGGVGAVVCGCCSSGHVYWGTRVGRGIAGCRQTCVAERVIRSVLRGVLGVVLCRASCCVGRRVVSGVVLCWASCCVGRRVVV
jgi:hypothetical protein